MVSNYLNIQEKTITRHFKNGIQIKNSFSKAMNTFKQMQNVLPNKFITFATIPCPKMKCIFGNVMRKLKLEHPSYQWKGKSRRKMCTGEHIKTFLDHFKENQAKLIENKQTTTILKKECQ